VLRSEGQLKRRSIVSESIAMQRPGVISAKQVELKFDVVAGAHRGAVLLLNEGDYRIGSSSDADIVLSDPGIVPEHAVLHVGRSELRLAATGAGVTVEQKLLPVSHGCRVRLPANLMLGAAQIRLSGAGENAPSRGILWRSLGVAGVLLGVGLAVVVARGLSPVASAASVAIAVVSSDDGAAGDSTSQSSAGSSTARSVSPTVEEAVRALNARLEAARIQTLRISAENGRLSAMGTLAGRAAADWAAIQQWFDQTYGSRFVLTTRLDPSSEPRTMPALQLQAIWYGARPYIVTADGEHYFNGAVLNNGWVIRDIGQDRVLLAKDGETVALNYR
jgi:hypothetical protein